MESYDRYDLRPSTKAASHNLRRRHEDAKALLNQSLRGSPEHQYELATEYLKGTNPLIPRSRTKAFFWFRRSAAQGFDYALGMLGNCYLLGHGVQKDDKEGFRLISLFLIKCKLRAILQDLDHGDTDETLKIMMETIFQYTGYIK
jgi:hypothetical protein